jgi:hypothetical protein
MDKPSKRKFRAKTEIQSPSFIGILIYAEVIAYLL